MRRVVGLGISRTAIRAVVLRRGRVVWAAERPLAGPEEIAAALADLAADRPRGVTRARVALEGELVRVKLLEGFPNLAPGNLRRAVALQVNRLFLRNGAPAATGALRLPGGGVLAAAAEPAVLEAVAEGCARAGLRLAGVGPGVGACTDLLPDGEHVLVADEVADRVVVSGGKIRAVRRGRAGEVGGAGGAGQGGALVPGLGALGARFLPACAAARRVPRPAFDTARASAEREATWRRAAFQMGGAALALWIGSGVVLAARVTAALRRAEAERVALGPALDAAIAVERDVALADEVLRAVRAAEAGRSRDGVLLAVLTAALPDSAHLAVLRRNRDGRATLVGYAPSAAAVLAALAREPEVVKPTLESGITRGTVAGRPRERFGIAFSWAPEPQP